MERFSHYEKMIHPYPGIHYSVLQRMYTVNHIVHSLLKNIYLKIEGVKSERNDHS